MAAGIGAANRQQETPLCLIQHFLYHFAHLEGGICFGKRRALLSKLQAKAKSENLIDAADLVELCCKSSSCFLNTQILPAYGFGQKEEKKPKK